MVFENLRIYGLHAWQVDILTPPVMTKQNMQFENQTMFFVFGAF